MEVLSRRTLPKCAPFFYPNLGRKKVGQGLCFFRPAKRSRKMYYYYIVERFASNGKWYQHNTYDHKITAMEMAQHFHEKDGEKYRVIEVQVRDIVITYENKRKKGVKYEE